MRRHRVASVTAAGAERGHPPRLRWRDYIQVVNTVLFVILGIIILIRSGMREMRVPGVIIGGGLLLFGVYRLRFIWLYFRGRR